MEAIHKLPSEFYEDISYRSKDIELFASAEYLSKFSPKAKKNNYIEIFNNRLIGKLFNSTFNEV